MSTTLTYILGIVVPVIGIGISVALHELGHMILAKKLGVKVPEYFVGFDSKVWSFERGETEYGVKTIWLGGYVELVGMLPLARPGRPDRRRKDGSLGMMGEARAEALEETQSGEEHRAFYHLSVPKRSVVMAGGVLTNLVLGIVLLAVTVGVVGIPGRTTVPSTVVLCMSSDIDAGVPCQNSGPVDPANTVGTWVDDRIVSWGRMKVPTWEELQAWITATGTSSTEVSIERDGVERIVSVTVIEAQRTVRDAQDTSVKDTSGAMRAQARPYVDIPSSLGTIPLNPTKIPDIIRQTIGGTVKVTAAFPVGLYHVVQTALGVEQRSTDSGAVGLVGIGHMAGNVTSGGVAGGGAVPLSVQVGAMLMLLGSLNLALSVSNLVPLLPLDGGRMLGTCWEGIRRSIAKVQGKPDPGPVDTARMLPISQVVFGLLITTALVLMWVDITASL